MKIKTILECETQNKSSILLFREGYFFRAYNRSAMRFVEQIKSIKVLRKYVKYLEEEVFYCGFPNDSLGKIQELAEQKGMRVKTSDEGLVVIGLGTENEDYEAWKSKIPVRAKYDLGKKPETFILGKLRNYPIDNRTPHETVQFVYEIKELIELFSKQ